MKKCVIINASNYPYGLASVEKIKLISKGLSNNGYKVYVLNLFSNIDGSKYLDLKHVGKAGKSIFIYTSGFSHRLSKIKMLLFLPIALIKEVYFFKRLFNKSEKKVMVLQYTAVVFVLWYYLLSKIFGAKLFINTMEYHFGIKPGVKAWFFDNHSYFFVKGVIVISDFLKNLVKKNFKDKPVLVLPVTVDFSRFPKNSYKIADYSLFCASAAYSRVFKFVINSFEFVKNENHRLVLVANGNQSEMNYIEKLIYKCSKKDLIKLYSSLEYYELIKKYKESKLLLIPMFDDERDNARFPHKIGEYTASKRPILATPVGEVAYYFDDGVNIFFSKGFSEKLFGEKLAEIIQDNQKADEVGLNGFKLGIKHFDYIKQGAMLSDFFNTCK